MKNSTETAQLVTNASSAGPLAYDYKRQNLYWVQRVDSEARYEHNNTSYGLRINALDVQWAGVKGSRVFHDLPAQSKPYLELLEDTDWTLS